MINALSAANAYTKQLKLAGDATEESGSANSGINFEKLVKDQLQDFVSTQHQAETAKLDAISGKGDIADLVTAIANAEMALNTIVTIRDKAIGAYQDIIRMPI
jgi:flagellar hook-basal body complex protein FliE